MTRLRRETRRFKKRAVASLILAIELFNRPNETARTEAVLILLQNAFEMLLKAAILEQRGTVFERRSRLSHTFEKCLAIARSDLGLLNDDMARQLRTLDGLRDCATHYLIAMPEEALYVQARAAVTLFDDVLFAGFAERLAEHLPGRVLPISTAPPQEIDILVDKEFTQIRELVAPGRRRQSEARARLRHLLIVESNVEAQGQQPTDREVSRVVGRVRAGEDWRTIFPGVANLRLQAEAGFPYSVRLTRSEGPPVRRACTPEEVEQAVFYREVNPLDRYSMSVTQLARHIGLTVPRTLALAEYVHLQDDPECFKEIPVLSTIHKCYSPKAIERLRQTLEAVDMGEVWRAYKERHWG